MKEPILLLLIVSTLICLFPRPMSAETGAFTAIDHMDTSRNWAAVGEGGVLTSGPGYKNNGLDLSFLLSDKQAWTVLSKSFTGLTLPANFKVSFYVKGKSPNETIEFKLYDSKGNVFWKRFESFAIPSHWEKLEIESSDLAFAWGPDPKAVMSAVDKIEIGVSIGTPGAGKISFDELVMEAGSPASAAPVEAFSAVASSNQENNSSTAQSAIDNNFQTRWSSPFTDPQWLSIDMKKGQEIAGLVIYWEAAFGSAYDILLSENGKDWTKVFSTETGDGKSDIIYFKPRVARYVKIFGRARGTAWGYSIYEVKIIKKEEAPVITVSSVQDSAVNILDGDARTIWTSGAAKEQSIVIDFKKDTPLGGLLVNWGTPLPVKRVLFSSRNNKDWTSVYSSGKGVKEVEKIYLDNVSARYLKLVMTCASGPATVKEITVKGPDEKLSPEIALQTAAQDAPEGYYPKWLLHQQEYWTITGVVDDDQESLLSEDGTVEPFHNSYSFAPILKVNGKLVTFGDVARTQSLEQDFIPMPRVLWQSKNIDLLIETFSADQGGKSSTYMEYTVVNKGNTELKGDFNLLLRPYQVNPPWMHGGLSRIESIQFEPSAAGSGMVMVNNRAALFIPLSPARSAAVPMMRKDSRNENIMGDIIEEISTGSLPEMDRIDLKDPGGYASACFTYGFSLKPGESRKYYFVAPLHDNENQIRKELDASSFAAWFAEQKSVTKKFWQDKLGSIRIDLPDREFVSTLKANIAYILINDDNFRLQPGSRNYDSSWMRDGALTARALLVMNYQNEVKRYLNWISKFIKADGWVPFIVSNKDEIETHGWKEFDSQGEYIYAIYQYYLFSKDKEFLADKKNNIVNNLAFMKKLRQERMTPDYMTPDKNEFYGIFPESASHEGYIDPSRHSYWDDFWGLRGLKDASSIFQVMNDNRNSKSATAELVDFRQAISQSLNRVVEKKGINYIPACAELGDFDPTSTAVNLWPCDEAGVMNATLMTNTFLRYWSELEKRFQPDWKGSFTPYELRNANAFIMLGKSDKLYTMITNFFVWKRPRVWNHWAEVVLPVYRMAQYLGDMPHTWIGAEYVNIIRNMLVMETGKTLSLCKGIPAEWFKPGDTVSITDMPTEFGSISYSITSDQNSVKMKISGKVSGQDKILLTVPRIQNIRSVKVNGAENAKAKTAGELELKSLPVEIVLGR